MNDYRAFGLSIRSALTIPEFLPASAAAEPDVIIRFGEVDAAGMRVTELGNYLAVNHDVVRYGWDEVGRLLIRAGREIVLDPAPGVEERLLRLPVFGNAFAALLHQRGLLTLHGSAVAINGQAALFMAGRGWGKSTLAATLYGRGHRLITDDLIAINCNLAEPAIIPGFPTLKLLPEAAEFALNKNPDDLPTLAIGYDKRACRELSQFSSEPVAVKHIFYISKGQTPRLVRLEPTAAIERLIGNGYIARTVPELVKNNGAPIFFHQCTRLLAAASSYQLERPQRLSLVAELAQLVEQQFLTPAA